MSNICYVGKAMHDIKQHQSVTNEDLYEMQVIYNAEYVKELEKDNEYLKMMNEELKQLVDHYKMVLEGFRMPPQFKYEIKTRS